MAGVLRQSTAATISFGPFVSPTDGVTLQTGLVSALDHASTGVFLAKNGGALTIRHASVTASTYDAYGNYIVTLDTTDTNTVGTLRVQFAAAASCLPVFMDFQIVSQTVFDALLASGAAGYGTAQTGDSYARLGAPAGASVSADVAAVKVDTAAIKVQSDKLTFTVSNQIDANVLDWKSATAPAMTGDAYARLGAPAGASVSADVAATKALLPTALVGGKMDSHVNDIASGAITATSIAADAITAAKIADGAIDAATFASGALDAVWSTAARTLTSFGTLAADVWASVTRTLTAGTNIVLAKGTGVTGFNDPAAATTATAVRTELTTELALIASNNAGISAIYNNIGVPQDWGSGATIKGNLDDANSWINVIMAVAIDAGYGNAALKALIDALPAAVRDVNNGSPAAGSLGEAARNADAKAASIEITLGTPAVTVSDDIAAIATATTAIGIRTAVGLSNPDLDTQLAAKPSFNDIFRATLTESYAALGAEPTLEQFLFMLEAQLRSRALVGDAPAVMTSRKLDGTTVAMTYDVDNAMDPTTQERAS